MNACGGCNKGCKSCAPKFKSVVDHMGVPYVLAADDLTPGCSNVVVPGLVYPDGSPVEKLSGAATGNGGWVIRKLVDRSGNTLPIHTSGNWQVDTGNYVARTSTGQRFPALGGSYANATDQAIDIAPGPGIGVAYDSATGTYTVSSTVTAPEFQCLTGHVVQAPPASTGLTSITIPLAEAQYDLLPHMSVTITNPSSQCKLTGMLFATYAAATLKTEDNNIFYHLMFDGVQVASQGGNVEWNGTSTLSGISPSATGFKSYTIAPGATLVVDVWYKTWRGGLNAPSATQDPAQINIANGEASFIGVFTP